MGFQKNLPEIDRRIKIVSVFSVVILAGLITTATSPLLNQDQAYTEKPDRTSGGQAGGIAYDVPASGEQNLADSADSSSSDGSDRKVITTVRTTLKVSKVDSAMQIIRSEVRSYNGFIESSSITKDSGNTGSMTVAVPSDDLSEFESSLNDKWEVKSRNVDREDVTDSYNELETEIESLKTEHDRLQELINQTDDVENLIRLQERMSQVRSQINYKQQRLDRMDENIEYSKVHIALEGPQTFESRFELRETLSEAYNALFESVKILIVGTAYMIPVAMIYGAYRILMRVRKRWL
jgi:hypothetical protein